MNLTATLGPQRESDAQRRVDQAVRFGVWATGRPGFPRPAEIQRQFGVSRATASRWRKSLARALAVAPPQPRRATAPATHDAIVAALTADPALLRLPVPMLVRDVRARFPGVGPVGAKRAINDAIRACVDGASHGTSRNAE